MQNNSHRLKRMLDTINIQYENGDYRHFIRDSDLAHSILEVVSKELDVLERQFKILIGVENETTNS